MAIDPQVDHPNLPVRIFVDNQSAIQSAGNPRAGPCQFLLSRILELHARLSNPLSLHWISAHVGVPGNEEADEAKIAAKSKSVNQIIELSNLIAPIFAEFKRMANDKWNKRWTIQKHEVYLRRIQPSRDLKSMSKFKGLSRVTAAILIQVRTGKIGLNDFLFSAGQAETDRCSCRGRPRQTAEHVLTTCLRWADLREDELWQGTGNQDMRTFLREPATAKRAAIFMTKTGLLGPLGDACLADLGTQEAPE